VKRILILALLTLPAVACLKHAPETPGPGEGSLAPAWTITLDAAAGTQVAAAPSSFLVATPGGSLRRIDAESGRDMWKIDLAASPAGDMVVSPGPPGAASGFVAVPTVSGTIEVVDLETGAAASAWEAGGTAPSLSASRDRLFAVSSEGSVRAFRVGSPAPLWEARLPSPPSAPGAICRGRLLVGLADGRLVGLDLETGEVRTRKNLDSPALVAPGCGGKRAYVATRDNKLHALRLYRRSAGLKWRIRTGADPAAVPLLHEDQVLLLSKDTFLYGFNASNGSLRFRVRLDRRPGPGALLGNLLFVAGPQSTRLDAFRLPDGRASGSYSLPEAARFVTPPVASAGRVAIVVARYGEESSRLVGLAPVEGPAPRESPSGH